jgi:hypothetical protein
MKSMKSGAIAALLVVVGLGVAVFGFAPDQPAARTGMQLAGVIIAALGVYQCGRLVPQFEKMRDEA